MATSIAKEIANLEAQTAPALRARWAETFGRPAPKYMSRDLLLRALTYHVQEQAEGGLRKVARQRLAKIAESKEKNVRTAASLAAYLKPGTRLVREWHGEVHQVTVLDDGFSYRGTRYASLSGIALAITGTRWSGPLFFGIRSRAAPTAVDANGR